jgi:hypothetical protein
VEERHHFTIEVEFVYPLDYQLFTYEMNVHLTAKTVKFYR